ncbi:AMP-binding protein [Candidatus Bipolaricaulota bacterium]
MDRLSESVDPQKTVKRGTSGTSGSPIETHMTRPEFRFRQMALLLSLYSDAGWAFPVHIVEAGAWITPTDPRPVIHHRRGPATVTYISRKPPPDEQAHLLAGTKPTVLTGSPSSLHIIASEFVRSGVAAPRPRVIAVRGEVLRPDVRNLLQEVFGGRVVDYYNCQEIGSMARQCRENPAVMHVNHDACVIEVVDDEGCSVSPGCEGDVVVTSLYNTSMPFVRYKLADRTVLLQNQRFPCRCGRCTETISPPLGRADDVIVLPDLQRVAPEVLADIVMAASRGVGIESDFTRSLRFQIIQESLAHITVRIASQEPCPPQFRIQVEESMGALHRDLRCDLEEVPEIDLGESGKLKTVLSFIAGERMAKAPSRDPARR